MLSNATSFMTITYRMVHDPIKHVVKTRLSILNYKTLVITT